MRPRGLCSQPEPVLVGDLELAKPIPYLVEDGRHTIARLLVRLHGCPAGEVVVPLREVSESRERLAAAIWSQIREGLREHLIADGLAVPDQLDIGGFAAPGIPRCRRRTGALPRITVVIATRDRPGSLARCLGSLSTLDYPSFDVVVVDSAPRSAAAADVVAARCWPFPVRYVRAARPGLALAHNTALPAVTGELVAFTDDDVEVDSRWLAALADGFRAPRTVCVTGLILPAELETPAQLWIEQAGGFARGLHRREFRNGQKQADRLFPFTAGRFGSGANMAFRTSWLVRGGGFDPATGAGTPARGGDDLLAFLRVIRANGTLVYNPAAIVRHWHRREYAGLRRQAYGYGVGLGAYLTAAVWAEPAVLGAMVRRAGPALRHAHGPGSVKNRGRAPDFPRELIWREAAGMLAGPFAYTASRWRYRHVGRTTPRVQR